MAQKISTGIDIGISSVKVVVAEADKGDGKSRPRIIGFGIASAEGMRHGYVTEPEEVARCLRRAIDQAQKSSGYRIDKAYFSIGGAGLEGVSQSASVSFGEKEAPIGVHDLDAALEACQDELPASASRNRDIIHSVPISYKIDGKPIFGKPVGMTAGSLEIKAFFVTAPSQHLGDLVAAAKLAQVDMEDVDASSVAASIALLSKSQQIAGCGLVSIGAETTSFAVFEDGIPISVAVFPLGSRDVTNDIALGFKVSLEEAERIKISRPESVPYPRKKVEEIIRARLEDIFDMVQSHLKKIGKAELLPAGVLITGGGAQNPYVEEIAKDILKLPAKKAGIKFEGEARVSVPNALWATAYGLTMIGTSMGGGMGPIRGPVRGLWRNFKRMMRKILP